MLGALFSYFRHFARLSVRLGDFHASHCGELLKPLWRGRSVALKLADSKRVGWVERSETHHRAATLKMGFARTQPILRAASGLRDDTAAACAE